MKKHQLAIATALFAFALTACDASKNDKKPETDKPAATQNGGVETITPDENKKNISYMIGYRFGDGLAQTNIKTFDTSEISKGLNDALNAQQSRLTQQQQQTATVELNQEIQKAEVERARAYIEAGKKFLTENAKREGVITTKSGLQYEVVTKTEGEQPKSSDVVRVVYEGRFITGDVFDRSANYGDAAEFPVDGVISGWSEALQLMHVGEKIKLYVPSDLAYGANGFPPAIPANTVLVFDLELLEIKKPEEPKAEEAAKPAGKPAVKPAAKPKK